MRAALGAERARLVRQMLDREPDARRRRRDRRSRRRAPRDVGDRRARCRDHSASRDAVARSAAARVLVRHRDGERGRIRARAGAARLAHAAGRRACATRVARPPAAPNSCGLREWLVVSQVALAFVLLVGAGLLIASFERIQRVDLGVKPDGVLTFELHLPGARYDSTARARLYEQAPRNSRRSPVCARRAVCRICPRPARITRGACGR